VENNHTNPVKNNQMKTLFLTLGLGSALAISIVGAVNFASEFPAQAKVDDNALMTNVPGFGSSRVETVSFCLTDTGVTRYQDVITDTQVETFGACLKENT
jgi:hypothetical protein